MEQYNMKSTAYFYRQCRENTHPFLVKAFFDPSEEFLAVFWSPSKKSSLSVIPTSEKKKKEM